MLFNDNCVDTRCPPKFLVQATIYTKRDAHGSLKNSGKGAGSVRNNVKARSSFASMNVSSCSPNDGPSCNCAIQASTSGLDKPFYQLQFSPSKALRTTTLKSRFADTIFKAQQTLHSNVQKEDPARLKQEMKFFAKIQQREKRKIEAEVKAAKAAVRKDSEPMMRIAKEREAARLVLQKVETSVEIDDFNQVVNDLEMLCSTQIVDEVSFTNPLEQLGLNLKYDELDDETFDQMSTLKKDGLKEENGWFEAQLKAVQAAAHKIDSEIKMMIVNKREAAHLILHKVVEEHNMLCSTKNVDVDKLLHNFTKPLTLLGFLLKDDKVDHEVMSALVENDLEEGMDKPFYQLQFSPSKALRAATLKSRFADTIFKTQQTLHSNVQKEDPARLKQKMIFFAKIQQREKRKMEAQVKAAKAAAMKDLELMMRIAKEREAVRLVLQKVEASVEIDDFNQVVKDHDMLCSTQIVDGVSFTNPLEQLGLNLKYDEIDDETFDQMSTLKKDGLKEENGWFEAQSCSSCST